MYDIFSWLSRLVRRKNQIPLERACIFDENRGCGISSYIPTHNLGTTFDFQAMALNCGYRGAKDNWWHIHHSAPARSGSYAQSCPHSYAPGHPEDAKSCSCERIYPKPEAASATTEKPEQG
jgi:hypothetical protein